MVCREEEPITPFIERARFLYEKCGISSVLVAGSSGAYFYIADTILQMDRYVPKDITEFAKKEAGQYASAAAAVQGRPAVQKLPDPALPSFQRVPTCNIALRRDDRLKTRTRGTDDVQLGHENIDLRYLEQLADQEQTAALSYILALAEKNLLDGRKTMTQLVDAICALMDQKGLAGLSSGGYLPTDLAMPRRQEIFACFNRYRGLKL